MSRVALALVLVLLLVPSAHAGPAQSDVGVAQATAFFGKQIPGCDHHGAVGYPYGGGMGISAFSGVKSVWMRFEGVALSAARAEIGALAFCMRLDSVFGNVTAVGAGCDVSKAYGGSGVLTWATSESVWLSDLGWKLGASPLILPGSYAVMTGRARSDHAGAHAKAKGKPVDAPSTFTALVVLGNGPGCFKSGPKSDSSGLIQQVVQLHYAIVPGDTAVDQVESAPLLCNDSGRVTPVVATAPPFVQSPDTLCLHSDKS